MKIYTKTGDKGKTSLFGGKRISKDNLRVETYGTVDELNSFVGLAATEVKNSKIISTLQKLQNTLFILGSELAAPNNKNGFIPRITKENIEEIEKQIDYFDSQLEELKNFILPSGSKGSVLLQVSRTICRRAERRVISLTKFEYINSNIIIFLNRISDLLFVLSRFENKINKIPDKAWQK